MGAPVDLQIKYNETQEYLAVRDSDGLSPLHSTFQDGDGLRGWDHHTSR